MGKKSKINEIIDSDTRLDSPTNLENIVEDLFRSDQDVDIEVPSDVGVLINPSIIRMALEGLVENSQQHTESDEITVGFDADSNTLFVSDTGSGIPASEISVIEEGEETDLRHCSGIGLWIVSWATSRIGSEISFDVDENGSTVSIRIPSRDVIHIHDGQDT